MSLAIRKADWKDLPQILEIYAHARQYMKASGNPGQWGEHHPSEAILRQDIANRKLHVCTEQDTILGVFFYHIGEDPTYLRIDGGNWLNEGPYGVIHRIAVAVHGKGVAAFCYAYALEQCSNLRIDTHADNIPMQRSLAKNGFVRCGTIYLENGDPRIAYQKSSKTGA